MPNEKDKSVLKWYQPRRLGLTGEYCGGIIAGCGVGIAVLAYLMSIDFMPPYWHHFIVVGLILMATGSGIARHSQRQHVANHDTHDE